MSGERRNQRSLERSTIFVLGYVKDGVFTSKVQDFLMKMIFSRIIESITRAMLLKHDVRLNLDYKLFVKTMESTRKLLDIFLTLKQFVQYSVQVLF